MTVHPQTSANPRSAAQPPHGDDLSLVLDLLHRLRDDVEQIKTKLEGTQKSHYSVDEVARMTSRAAYTVRSWVKAGRIRAERVSGTGPKGRLLIPRDELAKLIRQGKGAGVPAAAVDAEVRGGWLRFSWAA